MRALLDHCPAFWRSDELAASLAGGAFLAVDYGHWAGVSAAAAPAAAAPAGPAAAAAAAPAWPLPRAPAQAPALPPLQVLLREMEEGGRASARLQQLQEEFLCGEDWAFLCHRLMHVMGEEQVLEACNALGAGHCRALRDWVRPAGAAAVCAVCLH